MTENHLLRHFLAALSYRTTVAVKDAPSHYPNFEMGKGTRKPIEIINHMSFLLSYILRCYKDCDFGDFQISSWESEVSRFYDMLEEVDRVLSEGASPQKWTVEILLQGPFADAMTHVGQLTMCRRLADSVVPYENYLKADIQAGSLRPN